MGKMVETNCNLASFIFKEKLGICSYSKKIYLLGSFPDNKGAAIAILEKTPFSDTDVPGVFQESCTAKVYFQNDIYSSFCHFPEAAYSGTYTQSCYLSYL